MSSVVRRTLTGAALAATVAGLLWLDGRMEHRYLLWTVSAALACAGALEAAHMSARRGRPIALPLLAAVLAAFAATWLDTRGYLRAPAGALWRAAVPAAAAAAVGLLFARGRPGAALHALWIGVPLCLLVLWTRTYGHVALASLLVLSKVGDVAAYYGGRRFGRRHPFPQLSPGKTVEGCVFSLLAGVLAGALLARAGALGDVRAALHGALAGLLINVAAQAGDLFESSVKRRAGVKDSGRLLGASGGLLDVLDSLLFTLPVAWLAAPLLA
jgi:phosphatidate cytidylyltransferase